MTCNARNFWPCWYFPTGAPQAPINKFDPVIAGESLGGAPRGQRVQTFGYEQDQVNKTTQAFPCKTNVADKCVACPQGFTHYYTKGGICFSPCQDEVWYKAFLKQEPPTSWNTHDQQCQKFLAPSVFLYLGNSGSKQQTWSCQSRWKPGRMAHWGQRVITLSKEQD